jgi:glutamate racemase
VFDSGIGGLSVLKEIRRQLPGATLLYIADTAYAPYGDRDASFLVKRALELSEFLVTQEVAAIVIACNTASVHAAKSIRAAYAVPVIAMEPAIKPAALLSRSKVIAVLATSQTIASENVAQLVANYGHQVQVLLQACPGLVEHIESGDLSSAALRSKLSVYLRPLINQGADTIVLGCTHYSFLAPLIREMVGPGVQLIDPAPAVARELVRRLGPCYESHATGRQETSKDGTHSFYSSAPSISLSDVMSNILGYELELQRLTI